MRLKKTENEKRAPLVQIFSGRVLCESVFHHVIFIKTH